MNQHDFDDVRTAVREHVDRPAFGDLIVAGRRRRVRQRGILVGGLAVLVVLVLASTSLASVLTPKPAVPAGPSLTPDPVSGPLKAERVSLSDIPDPRTCQHLPVDLTRAYVVFKSGTCELPGLHVLAHTQDAGRTWSLWRIPGSNAGRAADRHAEDLVIDGLTVLVGTMLTRDGGQTWRQVPAGRGTPVAAAPAGWPVVAYGTETPASDEDDTGPFVSRLMAVDPSTGVTHPLEHQPRLLVDQDGALVTPAADGSLWVAGAAEGFDGGVAVSRDRGRSWKVDRLSGPGVRVSAVSSFDGRTAYARFFTSVANSHLTHTYRTVDGGRTWQAAVVNTSGTGLRLLSDGALLAIDQQDGRCGTLAVSRNGGRTFRQVTADNYLCSLERNVFGFVSASPSREGDFAVWSLVSADGQRFSRVPVSRPR